MCYIFVHLMKHVSYVHHIEGYYRIWPLSFVNYCRCTDMYVCVCVCVCVGGDTLCDQWVNRKCSHSGSTRSVQELPCLFTLCILYLLFYSVSQHCRPGATLWRCKAGRGCFVQTDGRTGGLRRLAPDNSGGSRLVVKSVIIVRCLFKPRVRKTGEAV